MRTSAVVVGLSSFEEATKETGRGNCWRKLVPDFKDLKAAESENRSAENDKAMVQRRVQRSRTDLSPIRV